MQPTRRQILTTTAGTLALWGAPLHARRRGDPIEELAAALLDAPRDRVLSLVEARAADGLTWRDLLAAVFHAGVIEVQPRPVGFKLHCVMVVESLYQTGEAGDARQGWLAALWNLDDLKRSQARDVQEGDWRLPAAPAAAATSAEAAARELDAALSARDAQRADRAVVAAAGVLERARLFEVLWPHCLRDFTNLGHEPIYCSHVARVLERVDGARAEPALRALVYGLLNQGPSAHGELYAASVEAAAELPAGWDGGRRDPARSLELARALRPASPAQARELVALALAELHPASVWDALRLVAADLFARRPALLPVHPTTVSSALYHVFVHAASETTRRVALLQAASWLPLYREALGMSAEPGGIDPLVAAAEPEPTTLEQVFREPTPLRTRAWLEGGGDAGRFGAALRTHLLERGAQEHHQHKYAAAILEDARSADPRWHPALLASALEYLPSARSPRSDLARRSAELAQRLGD